MAAEVAEVAVEVTVAVDGAAAADEVTNVTVPSLLIGTNWTAPDDVKLRR